MLPGLQVISGQPVFRQAGLRAGYTGGFFYQAVYPAGNSETGFMAMISFRDRGIQVSGMRIFYGTTLDEISPDLFAGWGYGGHAGFITRNYEHPGNKEYYSRNDIICPLAGIDFSGFLEYRFKSIPVSISLNMKPFIEIALPFYVKLMPGDFGISVAYYW
ncbi:MAG: hypothetical protein ACUVTX_08310 [Bacteroidales bacterium]